MDQIRIGIVGYGNLGRGVEYALRQNPDMALVGVFTRRPPSSLTLQTPGVPVYPLDALDGMEGAVDVLLLCGGSAADLPEQSPRYAGRFHLVDSFDTHANIPAHFAAVDAAARAGGKTAIISAGWDPGLFSLVRALAAAVLPCGESYTFWGRGVSQGHSDAVRRIPGVRDARQYTIPVPAALDAVRSGANPALTTRQKHMRECFVVAEEGADRARIEQAIITMPHYFADYDTTVGAAPGPRRPAPRRLCLPRRPHGPAGTEPGPGGIQADAGLQPGVHRLCPDRLCPSRLSPGPGGTGGL